MRRLVVALACVGPILSLAANLGFADEPDPGQVRAKAEHLQREAESLFHQAEEMERQRHDGPRHDGPRHNGHSPMEELHQWMDRLGQKMEQFRRDGRHDEAAAAERKMQDMKHRLEEMRGQQHDGQQHDGQQHDGPSPIEELHQRMGHLHQKMEQLRHDGRHDEAEGIGHEIQEVERQIREMESPHRDGPQHDGPSPTDELHQRMGHLHQKMEQLRHDGRHDEADGLEREMRDIKQKIQEMESPHDDGQHRNAPEHRRHALQAAADKLSEAANRLHEVDMHELADRICEAAEDLRRQATGHEPPHEGQRGPDGLEDEVRQLRHDLDELRDQFKRMHDQQ